MIILIVESDHGESTALASLVGSLGHTAITSESVAGSGAILRKYPPGLVLVDCNGQPGRVSDFIEMVGALDPQPPVIVTAQKATMEDAVQLVKKGAHDFWIKPVHAERLAKTIEWLDSKTTRAAQPLRTLTPTIITENPAMLRLKAMAKKVAASNATVFLQGESGTGKEVFARYIHRNSNRSEKPFIALNCAALPEGLLESELFGHEKGAFTGAIKAKEGKFELAHGGALLLDEVTEIPVHLQAKLLRVLQENEVDRVGGKHPIPVDARVIATTNLVPEDAIQEGRLRKDLYYRLNVIPLKIPPLRERREDVELLSGHFIEKYNRQHGCTVEGIAPEAMRLLRDYPWPGNVRELENVIQRAVLLATAPQLTPECLIFDTESPPPDDTAEEVALMPISEMEKRLIHKALDSVSGNRTRAAEILGISVRTLRNKLNEYRQLSGI